MPSGPRLRQVALVAHDCDQVAGELSRVFGWPPPFHDPGVGQFGLTNAVFAVGDTFVEVVAPARPDTTAGRYLERRGGDGGYMAIFQVGGPDGSPPPGSPTWGCGWSGPPTCPTSPGTHLHPEDVPGAIVSLDWADPEQSWRWAGPSWTGHVPDHCPGRRDRADDRGQGPGRRGTALGGGARGLRARTRAHHGRTAGPGPAAAVRGSSGWSRRGHHRGDHRRAASEEGWGCGCGAMGDWRGPLRRRGWVT